MSYLLASGRRTSLTRATALNRRSHDDDNDAGSNLFRVSRRQTPNNRHRQRSIYFGHKDPIRSLGAVESFW